MHVNKHLYFEIMICVSVSKIVAVWKIPIQFKGKLCEMYPLVNLALISWGLQVCSSDFSKCHDDPRMDPDEGEAEELDFTWLGTLQYIHIKKGVPHYFRAPRVVLISRQHVLSTAIDASQVPDGFALGNVMFGEYERDEEECGLSPAMLTKGARCEGAALLVPLADVLVHPEYPRVLHSIALLTLLTPISSNYMLPVCLPFKNFITTKNDTISQLIFHIDFSSAVPRDVLEEQKEVLRLLVLPKALCRLYGSKEFHRSMDKNRIMCTTGCGLHSGAPSLVHEHTGHWSVVALSQGWSPCTDPLRSDSKIPPPPQHTLLYPYVPWITKTINGVLVGGFAKDDPFGFVMPRSIARKKDSLPSVKEFGFNTVWSGHWWLAGIRCFDRGQTAEDTYKFYHEIFQIASTDNSDGSTRFIYYLEIETAITSIIVCVKVGFSQKAGNPVAFDIGTPNVKLRIPVLGFFDVYRFQVEAWATNTSDTALFEMYDDYMKVNTEPEKETDEDYFSWELSGPDT